MPNKISEYEGVISDKVPARQDMLDKWERDMSGNASLIKGRLDEKLSDDAAYQKHLAEPSARAFDGVLNPAYISKHQRTYAQMKDLQGENLSKSYKKWKRKLDEMFKTIEGVEAKKFKEQIAMSKDSCAEQWEIKGLRLTGDKIRGRGPASVGSYWLIGEPMAASWLKPGDKVFGTPFNIVHPGLEPAFQPAFVQRIIQGALMVIARKFDAAELTYQNDLTNLLVQSYVDPGLGLVPFAPGGESCVNLEKQGSLYILHIKVSQI